jgi:1-phosphofructokinase
MVYTVTFNPSIDYIVAVDDFKLGMTNRTSSELVHPGGKGVNVSVILNNLGIENTAFGFTAGFTGKAIAAMIEQQGVKADFIEIDEGLSRINFKLESVDGTEINGRGPDISEAKVEELLEKLSTLKAGDVVVLAGSIPHSMSDDIYRTILKRLEGKGVLSVVDATSTLLMNVLEYHPFLIKPNQHELGEIYNVELKTKEEVVPYARKMQEAGARNVLISMGGMGAVLVAEDGSTYSAPAPTGILKNSVGSGDSMVAGFMTGWLRTGSYEEAFKMGVAAGSASAFSDYLATKDEVGEVLKRVEVS